MQKCLFNQLGNAYVVHVAESDANTNQHQYTIKTPLTIKAIEADPRVHSVERQKGMDCYSVIIYLTDGHRAGDGTGTLYGQTVREAAVGIRDVTVGDPD